MFTVPLAIVMLVVHFVYADERAANQAAHEVCPDTHVTQVDEHFEFACEGAAYAVHCPDGECRVSAL